MKLPTNNGIVSRPIDPYSPLWPQYWAQNPHLKRGVGAEAAEGGEGEGAEGEGEGSGEDLEALRRDAAEARRLREENARLSQKQQEAEKHRKAQEKLAGENARKAAAAAGDIEALEKSWGEKYTQREQELSGELGTYRGMVEELTVGQTTSDICNKIAMEGCSPALSPHVRARLKSEIVDGKPTVRVLDAQGNISAMTTDDLIKELKSTPYLAPLIVGSKAGGAGAPGNPGGVNGKLVTQEKFRAMNPHEQAAYSLTVKDLPQKFLN